MMRKIDQEYTTPNLWDQDAQRISRDEIDKIRAERRGQSSTPASKAEEIR